jgi:hypothetical protein
MNKASKWGKILLVAFYLLQASLASRTHQTPAEIHMNCLNQGGRNGVCSTPLNTALSMACGTSVEVIRP